MQYDGGCHCGALGVSYRTETTPEQSSVRECQCTFCRAHASRNVSDPRGSLVIEIRDPSLCRRYRFGANTCDFLVCGRCGVYVAAVLHRLDKSWGTVNINALEARARFPAAAPVDFDRETADDKIARRMERWTPAVVTEVRGGG